MCARDFIKCHALDRNGLNRSLELDFAHIVNLWILIPIATTIYNGRLYRAGTGYTVFPAILPAVEGIILRMLRALKTCTKNLRKRKKKVL